MAKITTDPMTGIFMAQRNSVAKKRSTLKKFSTDFFKSPDPLTEIMIRVESNDFIRLENLDFADKDHMLVN